MSALSALIIWSIVLAAGALGAAPRVAVARPVRAGVGALPAADDRVRASRSPIRPRSRSPGAIRARDPDDPPPGPRHFGPAGPGCGGDPGP